MSNKNAKEKSKRFIVITGLILLVCFATGFVILSIFPQSQPPFASSVAKTGNAKVEGAVAGDKSSENYNQMLIKHDTNQAENALETGASHISIPAKTRQENLPPLMPPKTIEQPLVVKNDKEIITTSPPQKVAFTQDQYKRVSKAIGLLDKKLNSQIYQGGIVFTQNILEEKSFAIARETYDEMPQNSPFKAGEIYYAIVDTAINSDVNSVVLATIISGEHRKTKFIGSFARIEEKLIIRFNRGILPDGTEYSIEAYAVDPEITQGEVASKVDTHFFSRWGGLLASSFLEGFGKAKQLSGAQVMENALGEPTGGMVFNSYSLEDQAWIAGGNVGEKASEVFAQQFNRPPTVYLNSGAPLGVLVVTKGK